MLLVESGGQSKVGKLDVTCAVDKDVVRLDVSEMRNKASWMKFRDAFNRWKPTDE